MALPASRFLDPGALAAVRDLRLLAKLVVEGFLAGLHTDLRTGAGIELSHHRAYEPGDDPRRIDHRAWARSDRPWIREAEVERDITVRILLDTSGSMAHRDDEDGPSKLDYGRVLAACLAYLAERQGDRFVFHALGHDTVADLHAGPRRGLGALVAMLEQLETGGGWPSWEEMAVRFGRRRTRELVVLITDLHPVREVAGEHDDSTDELRTLLAGLRALGHEIWLAHLVGRRERDLDYRGDLVFVDLETGATVRADADALRPAYLARREADLEAWRSTFGELGVAHEEITLDQPFESALRAFLLRRQLLP